ncbi:MAG: RluA family pseudouridine synthase [Emergencia sp.]
MSDKETIYEFHTDEEQQGTRIDRVLSLALPDTSRSFIQKLFEQDGIQVNGQICRVKKYKVSAGDRIKIIIPPPEVLEVQPEDIPLDIVYEDEDVLVVHKPKGMVVHPAVGNYTGTLVNAIMFHCGDRLSSINGVIRPGIVHRIDKDTSGLLMIAKNDAAHESLSEQLSEHTITRRYQALVYHNLKEDEGTIDAPIGRDPSNRLRQAVTDREHGKRAVTHYRVLERFGKYTLIEASLETGRTHQIRVHMAHIKHPLVGDLVYGPKKAQMKVEGQLLHAKVLGFVHPRTNEYMEFEAPLPEDFEGILAKLRKEQQRG